MLAIAALIVDYTFKMCFNFLYSTGYILQVGPPNVTGLEVTYPLLSLSTGLGALITH